MIMAEPLSRKASKPLGEPQAEPPPEPIPETELVKRARRGDLAAYDDLVRRYQ